MNTRIQELYEQAHETVWYDRTFNPEKFAQLIVQECVDKLEAYEISVGNSAAGELACEWTYAALHEIRDDIREVFKAN